MKVVDRFRGADKDADSGLKQGKEVAANSGSERVRGDKQRKGLAERVRCWGDESCR